MIPLRAVSGEIATTRNSPCRTACTGASRRPPGRAASVWLGGLDAHPASNRVGLAQCSRHCSSRRYSCNRWGPLRRRGPLLLLACAIVANLLVAQGATRQGEIVSGRAGRGRTRCPASLFTETGLGAALALSRVLFFASWSIAAAARLATAACRASKTCLSNDFPRVACLAAWLAASSLPGACDHGLSGRLRTAMDAGLRQRQGRRLRTACRLPKALALLLLVVAACWLIARAPRATIPGSIPHADGDVAGSLNRALSERAAGLDEPPRSRPKVPGLTIAAATSTPLQQFGFINNVTPEDRAASRRHLPPTSYCRSVTPVSSKPCGPVLAGRTFSEVTDGASVCLVNHRSAATLARWRRRWEALYWGGTTGRTRTVIGVTGDFQDEQLDAAAGPILFVPHAQVDVPAMTLLIQTPLGDAAIAPALRAAVRSLDPALPAPGVHRVEASRFGGRRGTLASIRRCSAPSRDCVRACRDCVYAMLAFTAV